MESHVSSSSSEEETPSGCMTAWSARRCTCCSGATAKCVMLLPRSGRRNEFLSREKSASQKESGTHGKGREEVNVDWAYNIQAFVSSSEGIHFVVKLWLPEGFPSQILATWKKVYRDPDNMKNLGLIVTVTIEYLRQQNISARKRTLV